MAKRKEPLLNFTKSNLKIVRKTILNNLTPDLLPKKWYELNEDNPCFGHCHTASGVVYEIFTSQNVHLYKSHDASLKLVNEEMYHWFLVDIETDEIIDVTAPQYSNHPRLLQRLYKTKIKQSGTLGFAYRKRVQVLLSKVRKELRI